MKQWIIVSLLVIALTPAYADSYLSKLKDNEKLAYVLKSNEQNAKLKEALKQKDIIVQEANKNNYSEATRTEVLGKCDKNISDVLTTWIEPINIYAKSHLLINSVDPQEFIKSTPAIMKISGVLDLIGMNAFECYLSFGSTFDPKVDTKLSITSKTDTEINVNIPSVSNENAKLYILCVVDDKVLMSNVIQLIFK